MAGPMAGSTDSEVWTLAGSVESDVWSDVAASSAKILDTDWVHIASDLQSTQASFKPFEETMPISNMSPKPTVQLSSKVTDWVEQQALEDGGPGTADAGTVAEATFKPSLVAKTGSKKYDIATLLQLRYTTDLANIELRIHPSALQEQIFKPAPYISFPRSQRRSRGLSDVSLNSLHSIPSDEEVIYRKSRPIRQPFAPPLTFHEALQLNFVNRLPRRQPCSPPTSSLAQQHDGFARFLKEHASPPHQRVTAGGRIVPASGPPPIFNVDSLRASTSASTALEPTATPQEISRCQAAEDNFRRSAPGAPKVAVSNATENLAPGSQPPSQAQRSKLAVEVVGSTVNKTNGQHQLQLPSTPQIPVGNTPIVLADGSNVVTQNGIPYRVYWNGFQTVSEPVIIRPAAMPDSMPTNLQPIGFAPQYSIANPYANVSNLSITLPNTANGQHVPFVHPNQQKPDHVLERQQETLRYELKKLDKHIALRSHMFSALEHASYVAQRKHLVEQMDNIRVSRGRGDRSSSSSLATSQSNLYTASNAPAYGYNAAHQAPMQGHCNPQSAVIMAMPINHDAQGLTTGPPWDSLVNGVAQAAPAIVSATEPQQKTPPTKRGLGASSILSPDAPPFFPSSIREGTARKVETCLPNDQRGNVPANAAARLSSIMAPTVNYGDRSDVTTTQDTTTIPSANKDSRTTQQNPAKGLRSHGRSGISGSWSAMDDVVPMVHQADIAYVDNLGLNPVQEPKLYCSTVTEFQEVIRRVREQARLYGCAGGQSKDPEFDAEQDVRWAMADSSPVPLPKKMPDHIANPRPWNWNDSAFNIRADRSHLKSRKSKAPMEAIGENENQNARFAAKADSNAVSHGPKFQENDNQEVPSVESTASARMSAEPRFTTNSDRLASDWRKLKTSGATRTVMGELSPNNQAATTKADSFTGDGSVDVSKPALEIAVRDDEAAWQNLLKKHDAQMTVENKAPVLSQLEVKKEDTGPPERRLHQAYVEDDAESLIASVAPGHVKAEMTVGNEEDKMSSTIIGSQAAGKEGSASEWTKEDQDAVDAAYGDPFRRSPTPDGWSEMPLPPEILSKMPFKMEDLQKGPQGDPYVHVPSVQQYQSPRTGTNGVPPSTVAPRPLGYNQYKPISIPSGSMSTGNQTFLRDMLKSPRYSTSNLNQQNPIGPSSSRHVSFGEASRQPSNKENFRSSMKPSSNASYTSSRPAGIGNTYYSSQDARLSKAQSSVAPSSHYAQGYLPQYPGPGSLQSSDYYVHYHTNHPYGRVQERYPGSSQPRLAPYPPRGCPPQYDGGADSPPRDTNARSEKPDGNDGKKEAKVDPKDFETDRGDIPSGHSYAVDRLFQTVRAAERKDMGDYDQKGSKRS